MKHRITSRLFFLLLSLFLCALANNGYSQTATAENTARVGVLAFRGTNAAKLRWQPLVDYLSHSIKGWHFEFVPVTLPSTPHQIETRGIDFLVTNPGHYVELQEKYGLSTLATRERRTENTGSGVLEFGTAIITRKDSNIRSLADIKDKTIAAVSPDAFGGYQIAWHEFMHQNIDPLKDLKSIQFMGFPQDAIITAVDKGLVEVGIVRSGLLELLAKEGKLDIASFRVVQSNNQIDHPHMVSSQLYPEWPFASLPATNKQLRESVLIALLATQNPEIAQTFKLRDLWSTPLTYGAVRNLVNAYKAHNVATANGKTSSDQSWIATLLIALLVLALITAYLQITRRRRRVNNHRKPDSDIVHDPVADEFLSRFACLTKREREILCLICCGSSSKVIAYELGISVKTVEYHRANLLKKTQAGTTPQLVQIATRLGFDENRPAEIS
jgi:two-component system sensor histidine kinase TtrS